MILNISTLVVGEKYRNYCDLLLHSLNANTKQIVNVYITHDGGYNPSYNENSNIKIFLNVLPEWYKEHMGKRHFPFFLKNEALKFASNYHKDGDYFLHVDCDTLFKNDPYEMIESIYKNFNRTNCLYVFKNHSFKTVHGRQAKGKHAKLFENVNIDFGVFNFHESPNLNSWFFEAFLLFNISKDNIIKFTEHWDNAIRIIIENGYSYRPDSIEIAYSCYHTNTDMVIIWDWYRKKYFNFLNKNIFNRLFKNKIEMIYNHLSYQNNQ